MVLLVLVGFCALVAAVVALMRIADLRSLALEQQRTLESLERRVTAIDRDVRQLQATPRATDTAPTSAPASAPPVAPPEPLRPPVSMPIVVEERARESRERVVSHVPAESAESPETAPKPSDSRDSGRPAPLDSHDTVRPEPYSPFPTKPSGGGIAFPTIDWENLVGVKLFSWIAAIALALGALFFLRYSIQAGWLQPPIRMAIGIVAGLALLAGCEMKVARNYPVTANALDAAGIVILFLTFFAGYNSWHLIGIGAAFFFLALVTTVAVLLSLRRDSPFIASLGLIGGFLTPALLSTGQDNPIGLFGYLLLLDAGLSSVAYRKRWSLLTAASVALTTVYQWAWVGTFLTEAKLPLATGIFLVFPILAALFLALGRGTRSDRHQTTFVVTTYASAVLPLLFAAYLAGVPAYAAHARLLFVFLLVVDTGLLVMAVAFRAADMLHVVGGIATNVIFFRYLATVYPATEPGPWPAILGWAALFVLFYLFSPLATRRLGWPFAGVGRRSAYVGSTLLWTVPAVIAFEPATASAGLVFAVLFVLLGVASGIALVERDGGVHFVAAFFALVAEAVWSARFLDEARLLPALVVYLVFALFYIGVPVLARRIDRPLEPRGAGGAILLVSLALLFFPAGLVATDSALWGLSLLLAILNVATFVEGSAARRPVLSLASTVISWLVICGWWSRATPASLTGSGLLVVAGFTILTVGGHIWNARRSAREDLIAQNGAYLGLVGHLFLLFVAGQPSLSLPPWPMLAVLLVLDLAVGVGALYLRQANLHLAAVVASALVLYAWQSHAAAVPWPAVAIVSAGCLALLAAAWMWLARRVAPFDEFVNKTDAGVALACGLGLLVATFAGGAEGAPPVAFLASAAAALLVGLLAVASARRWNWLAVAGAVLYSLIVAAWHDAHADASLWLPLLVLAGALYGVFLAYPLALGRRVGSSIHPHLAAVVASAVFFFAGRHALTSGGYESVIGALPVTQALLMAVLLIALLRLKAPSARDTRRLALVAGAALAFVTVAIPLQLEKEWITIGWALEGAALAWLYRRVPYRGLVFACLGLLAATFVRLANPAVLVYRPRGPYRIWNWYLYTYLVSAGALLCAARFLRDTNDRLLPNGPGLRVKSLAASGSCVLLFLLMNIEIADFYSVGPSITFNLAGTLAQDMTYTLGWGLFAVGLLVAGIVVHSRPTRFAALMLLVVTALKGFLHDLARLGGLYRVASFVGLAICLALVAVVLQKFVLRPRDAPEHVAH